MNRRYIAGVFAGAAMATSLVVLGMNLAPAAQRDVTLTSDTELADAPVEAPEEAAPEEAAPADPGALIDLPEEAKPDPGPDPEPDPTTTTTEGEPEPDPTTTTTGNRVEKVEKKIDELDSRVDQLETQMTATTATTTPSTPTGPAATPTTMTNIPAPTAPDYGPPNWSYSVDWQSDGGDGGWLVVLASNNGGPSPVPNLRLPVHYQEKWWAEKGGEMRTFYLRSNPDARMTAAWRVYLSGVERTGDPIETTEGPSAGEVTVPGGVS